MTLEPEDDGTYRITTNHPKAGPGCMGVRDAVTTPGPNVYDDYCGSKGANRGGEKFRLRAVSRPTRGYQINPAHTTLCLGFPEDSSKVGAVLFQVPCDPTTPTQVFLFDPR